MKNNNIFPFERNRFYSGKLLTSDDFQAEQNYMNHKRRFLNHILFGEGIVCGLGVGNVDDCSVMIEPGAALDRRGREIVVGKSFVKKLSSIDGFNALQGKRTCLCIEYAEEEVHPVYSIEGADVGREYEYNRISEGFRIFLINEGERASHTPPLPAYVAQRILYADSDFSVRISVPSIVSCKEGAQLLIEVEKLSSQSRVFDMDAIVQIPAFSSQQDEKELHSIFEQLLIEQGQTIRKYYPIYASSDCCIHTNIILKSALVHIKVDGLHRKIPEDVMIPVKIVDAAAEDIVAAELGMIPMDERLGECGEDFITLCTIDLRWSDSTYLIEKINPPNPDSYLRTAAQYQLERRCLSYFMPAQRQIAALPAVSPIVEQMQDSSFAGGLCEIPIKRGAGTGRIFYSDEIMHGLGRGNIYIQCGIETVRCGGNSDDRGDGVIYGDTRLFARQLGDKLPRINCAVNVLKARGTFVAAVELLEPTELPSIKLRWNAVRLCEHDPCSTAVKINEARIFAAPSTIMLFTKESGCLNVRFQNMQPTTLHYELTEKDSGAIGSDGVYTAPAHEGVFEIHISCVDIPAVSTYAYAVVKKKGMGD